MKRPSIKVSVAVEGSLNRISHYALPFFARPPEGRVGKQQEKLGGRPSLRLSHR